MGNWLFAHRLLIAIILGVILTTFWLYVFRDSLRMRGIAAPLLSLIGFAIGYALVRIFASLEGASSGSMSLFGAELFLPIFFLLGAKLTKRSGRTVSDLFTPCFAAMMIISRIHCLVSGCCYGKVIPWMSEKKLRWPTRELEIVFYTVFLLLFIPRIWKYYKGDAVNPVLQVSSRSENQTLFNKLAGKKPFVPGTAYPIFMMAYGVFRFFVEFFRKKSTTNVFHLSHLWALISLAAGALFWYELKAEEKLKAKKKKRR